MLGMPMAHYHRVILESKWYQQQGSKRMMYSAKSEDQQYREYGYRYAIVAIFFLLAFVNGMCWVVVTPISVPVGKAFSQSDAVVSIIPMCYMAIYVFVNFPSNWVLDVRGVKKGIVVGAVVTAVGAAFRCLVSTNFFFVIAGQVLCGIAQPFILNAPTKIAVRWFLPQSRSVALAILSVANIIGTAVGFLLPPFFVDSNASEEKVRSSFAALLLFEFFACLIPLTLVMLWFRESPPTPVSPCSQTKHARYSDQIKGLFRDKKFIGLLIAFGCLLGVNNINGSLLDNMLDCYGYSSDQVSYFAAAMMVCGILSATVVGLYIEKTLKYRRVFRVLCLLGLLESAAFPIIVGALNNFPLVLLACSIMGIVLIPFMPLSFDYGCDVLYPAGEAQITGCLMTSGNFLGVILVVFSLFQILISQNMLGLGNPDNSEEEDKAASLKTIIMTSVVTAVGLSFYFFFNSELKRSKLDNQRKNNSLLTAP